MCGICGFTGAPDRDLLRSMTRSLTHRGPDGEGFYFDERIGSNDSVLSISQVATSRCATKTSQFG